MNSNRCSPRTNSTPRVAHHGRALHQPAGSSIHVEGCRTARLPWRHRARTVRWRRQFLGLQPEGLRGDTRFIAAEYEPLTAAIAKALYPQASILPAGFQTIPLPENSFDMAIGNPPFGNQPLYFPHDQSINGLSIHNQFFVASMKALKPGGLQIMVVSSSLMDAKDASARKMLATQAELIGAVRLPDTAFGERRNQRGD